ncbi:exopolysaccharide biosynthesis protein [Aquibium carbonis]|nr:exopolysaccharide biosynthesis protein [Aquibium carbonis]
MSEPSEPGEVESLVETVESAAEGDGDVSVEELVETIGGDALASLMLVPALIMVSPASGIPGLSTACATIVALAALQLAIGRHTLWLPGFLGNRRVARSKLDTATHWLQKPARFLDRLTGQRLAFLAARPFSIAPALLCVLIAFCVPFLELVPFSASIAGAAIGFIALGLVARDGVLIILGLLAALAAASLVWSVAT